MATDQRTPAMRFYNPDWLDDADLLAGFIARRPLLAFFTDELQRAPLHGTVTHYLLVGVRGAGKTTLLKRLAVAIRQESALADHLIALSFPEELYEVKGLADFWWAGCEALADELDRIGARDQARQLENAIDARRQQPRPADAHDAAGLQLLLDICRDLQRRPVLLVDNLDFILRRIDKSGRKLNDPHAHAYWALREVLSKADAPLMIAGSVRLSEPFTDYDKAFYDFFVPQRLGKLELNEVRDVFDHLALHQGGEALRERINKQPGRIQALYEMTGGNPRALGLLFELLRQGPGSRAIDDFERLLDLTTPYYKARFEDLPEQAQVVMHALAVVKRDIAVSAFGHTAAALALHTGLETRTVSAQLDVLVNEGVVEKDGTQKGRTQYRIAEQLFRLWLQMRSSRRIRQNVIGLTEFLQAFFEREEYEAMIRAACEGRDGGSLHGRARMHYALSELLADPADRRHLLTHAADAVLQESDGPLAGHFAPGDLPPDLEWLTQARAELNRCHRIWSSVRADAETIVTGMLGALMLTEARKHSAVERLCDLETAADELDKLAAHLSDERKSLKLKGFLDDDLHQLYRERSTGYLHLPGLKPTDRELADSEIRRKLAWKLLIGLRIPLPTDQDAEAWMHWASTTRPHMDADSWAAIAGVMLWSKQYKLAQIAIGHSFAQGESAIAWCGLAALEYLTDCDPQKIEATYRKAIEIDPMLAWSWNDLGALLSDKFERYDEAETAYRKAIDVNPMFAPPWNGLGNLLANNLKRYNEAEAAYRKAIDIDPMHVYSWNGLGNLLAKKPQRYDEAETAYRKAIDIDPMFADPWHNFGNLLSNKLHFYNEAEAAYRKAIEIDPMCIDALMNLGNLLADKLQRFDEAEATIKRALDIKPEDWEFKILFERIAALRLSHQCNQFITQPDRSEFRKTLESYSEDKLASLTSDASFASQVVAPAIRAGHGEMLQDLFRELDFDRHSAPLMYALTAAIKRDAGLLYAVEPEAQRAAIRILGWLLNLPESGN